MPPITKCRRPEETWDKLTRGIFVELRIYAMPEIIKFLLAKGLADWSQIAFTTDDRSASHTLALGATDYNARLAIESGLAPEIAIQCVTINPARHMRLTPYVGSLAPGRFADVVLLEDVPTLKIAQGLGRRRPGLRRARAIPATCRRSIGRPGRPIRSTSSAG